MLVYGDRSRRCDPRAHLDAIERGLADLPAEPGLNRHAALAGLLIEAGKLLQGVADADFAIAGADRRNSTVETVNALVCSLAEAVCRSWESGFAAAPVRLPPRPNDLPSQVELRAPEGFAFYALYPESVIEAARALRLAGPPRLIGIRSIGASLAALAAAALDAPPPVTVRPFGDPYDRKIEVAADLAEAFLAEPATHYVIVDEGPGRSGSSFGAVAGWLEAQGVPGERIAFICSHDGGPGPNAAAANRERWARTQRAVADFGFRLPALLAGWAEEVLGPLDGPLIDISAGAWRNRHYADAADWPASDVSRERRKFLATSRGETWLLKFAGLGSIGAGTLERARALHAARLVPEPRGLAHGFLVERWHGDARPLDGAPPLDHIARYLGARARLLPADKHSGASLPDLLAMSRRNAGLALGARAAAALDRWEPRLDALAARVWPVETDNRVLPHEWLHLPDGRLLKSDALDHHAGHDLIGCQDITWDVAGAIIEFGLDDGAAETLACAVGCAAGREVDRDLLAFLMPAYCAFRLGQATLATETARQPAEAARLDAKAKRYAAELERRIVASGRSAVSREP